MMDMTASPMDRRAFLTFSLGACCAVGLTACGQSSSKGSYDDGYSAGYAAGMADAEAKAKQEEEEKAASAPYSGIECTITGASLANEEYSGKSLIVIDVTAKNVASVDKDITFGSGLMNVYQDGKGLTTTSLVEGRERPDFMRTVKPGVSMNGWVAYELIDSTTPVECAVNQLSDGTVMTGLTNPQTIDLSTL